MHVSLQRHTQVQKEQNFANFIREFASVNGMVHSKIGDWAEQQDRSFWHYVYCGGRKKPADEWITFSAKKQQVATGTSRLDSYAALNFINQTQRNFRWRFLLAGAWKPFQFAEPMSWFCGTFRGSLLPSHCDANSDCVTCCPSFKLSFWFHVHYIVDGFDPGIPSGRL